MKGSSVDKPSAPKGYTLDEKIGEGASARVWLGTNNQLQKQVAIKIITKSYLKDPNQKNKFLHEIQLHGMANHPYIAQLFGVKDNVFNYYLIMEYLPRGTLLEKVMSVGHLSENETLRFFTQITSAVKYLHGTLHVVHRDLKLDNIMIDDNDNLKLIDFGFSHDYSPEDEKLNTPCGSPSMFNSMKLMYYFQQIHSIPSDFIFLSQFVYIL
ncbi:CAMK family protein kinase [Tritrichomonas foetus]|uniref:CAMK family protein kinase n=1 Tax=Tritrichomonas foetus TaxID=1144522 RepID=A0A1J4J8T1_9EUKA|nr:CAMK family protein kinase [Tritrichomonas foetus]|eukprot:OHS95594.1 CAMK family protein kinase [Tritrichomonas foetus]